MIVVVEGLIIPKQRPRMNTKTRRTYTPQKTLDYERLVREAYIEQDNRRFEGLLELKVIFYFKIPKSYSKKRIEEIKDKYCGNHKDIDNCIKSIMDSLLKVAYEDDKQITKITASKKWTTGTERVEFEIKEIDYE